MECCQKGVYFMNYICTKTSVKTGHDNIMQWSLYIDGSRLCLSYHYLILLVQLMMRPPLTAGLLPECFWSSPTPRVCLEKFIQNICQSLKLSLIHRISFSCLFPASWHFSLSPVVLPRLLLPSFRQLLLLGLLAAFLGLVYLLLVTGKGQNIWVREDKHYHRSALLKN